MLLGRPETGHQQCVPDPSAVLLRYERRRRRAQADREERGRAGRRAFHLLARKSQHLCSVVEADEEQAKVDDRTDRMKRELE